MRNMLYSKFSVFSTYALLSVFGFGGFWWVSGTSDTEGFNPTMAFLAFYSFLCATVVFYVIVSEKQSMESAIEMLDNENNYRSRDIDAVYRYIDIENEKVARKFDSKVDTINHKIDETNRRLDLEVDSVSRELDRLTIGRTEECCKAL